MARQDRGQPGEQRGRDPSGRYYGRWSEDRDADRDRNESPQWGRHQPRQGGDFEDRYAGRGGGESRGDERSQRGEWRGQSYGRGRYENEDYLSSGGSYGGQHDQEEGEGRYYSPNEGSSQRDFGREQYGDTYYGARDERGYGYESDRDQDFERGRRSGYAGEARYGQGWQPGRRGNQERSYGQGYGAQSHGSGTSGRYGGDYSLAGAGLSGEWDRGFSDMSRGTSGGYPRGGAHPGGSRSWSGAVDRPQRESFRGRGPKGYERSDERLKEIICERLMDDADIDASEIAVDVRNHEVTLQGTVEDRRTKYEVEELVESCGGVKDVKNELRVRARSSESGDTTSSAQQPGWESSYGTSGMSGITSGSSGSPTSGTSGSSG